MNRPANPEAIPVRILTLGCKVNQHESACLLERLCATGRFREARRSEAAGLCLVNTCAVTARAQAESRRLIARAGREAVRVVATGCAVEADPELAEGCELAVGNAAKEALVERLLGEGAAENLAASRFGGRARASLKVQDGCDGGCSYCLVPRLRGRSRSLPAEKILAEMERLAGLGFREVVLCAIHLGAWGRDLSPPASLAQLLEAMCQAIAAGGLPLRLRLSSLDPPEALELLPLLRAYPAICRHLHISLQSGSDAVLGRMRRRYSAHDFTELAATAAAKTPGLCLGCDVIAGFPGETPEEFGETLALLEALPISYLHVFPFSPRPHTLAATMPAQLSAAERALRAAALRDLSARQRKAFYQAQVGTTAEAVIQGRDRPTGLRRGLTDNYVPVLIDSSAGTARLAPRGLVRVRVDRVLDARVVASPLGYDPGPLGDPPPTAAGPRPPY